MLYRLIFFFTTALALVDGNQPSLLYVKPPVFDDFPLMKTTLAQGFTFVLL